MIEKIKSTLFNTTTYDIILDKILTLVIIFLVATVAIKVILKIIEYAINTSRRANEKLGIKTNNKRTDTIHKLIRSIVRYVVYFIVIIQILSLFGVNTTGILASAGLVSVAIGFGAQSLVKDIITGFFIVLENQFDVGDYVKIYNQTAFIAEGHVLSLGLRSTKIQSLNGEVYFIPNSSINQVVNHSQNFNLAKISITIMINGNIGSLEEEINNLLLTLNSRDDYIKYFYKKEKLKINAITEISDDMATVDIVVKCQLSKQAAIETLLRKDFYDEFKSRIRHKEN